MAKKNTGGGGKAAYVPKSAHKMGEIQTAAKSTMGPTGYEKGYPAFENETLANQHNANKGKRG